MGEVVRPHTYPDGAAARPDHSNENETILYNVLTKNIDWANLNETALANLANGLVKLDGDAKVPTAQLPASIAANVTIADAGGRYTAAEVEAALQEIAGADRTTETVIANAASIISILADIAANLASIVTNAANIATNTGNIPSSNAVVKAWIRFNGEGVIAIQDSFNVASIVDNGTGDYTINWDTDFANDNYACVISAGWSGRVIATTKVLTAASVQVRTFEESSRSYKDSSLISVIAIGDQ